jgi:putative ABC transport system ATP-binding protein
VRSGPPATPPSSPVTRRDVLRRVVLGQRRPLGLAALLFSLHQAGEALVPVLIGVIIDRAVTDRSAGVTELLLWIGVLGVVFAMLSLSYRFGARKVEAAAEWAAHGLRLEIARRVLHPRGGAETGRLPGALANIATSDAQRVGAINTALANGTAAVVAMLVGGIALVRVSLPLGLLVLIGGPFLLWLVHLLGKPLESRSEAEQDRAAQASGVAADLVTGLRVLKGIGAEDTAVNRYRATSRESLAATLRAARAQAGYEGAMLTMSGGFLAIVAFAGGRLALQGEITVGQLVSAVGLAQFLLGPLLVFAWVSSELAQGRASAGRIAEVLAGQPAVGAGTRVPVHPAAGAIRLRGLSHAGLSGVDLEIPAGELLGVVATDPADSAALLRCLGREVDPESGAVELDDVRLADLDPDDLRSVVLVAAHDADLFGGTLIENVDSTYGGSDSRPDGGSAGSDGDSVGSDGDSVGAGVPVGRIQAAMRASGADDVSRILPAGTQSVLAERGSNLSGGQRQRVALARALGADATVLVLHDPTTAVDTVTEAAIATGIRELRHNRTTILVTSSPALLAVTDRVVLLVDGRITTDGTHQRLIRDDETYRTAVLT